MSSPLTISTPITQLFGIKYPILLAGMNKAAGPKLAAIVSNNGGLGVIGGITFTPKILRTTLKVLKSNLIDETLPFGVDLALPQIGGNARKTNYDYTKGKLDELIDVIIEFGAKLFVSAIGIPPLHVVKKLHAHNIFVMNMIGHPKHIKKACSVGVDLVCCQGGEGGGHSGSIPTSLLIPKCVDIIKQNNYKSPLTNSLVNVIGAGGIYDGRGLAMALSLGAQGVWVGTRFVASLEGGASLEHKKAIVNASYDDTVRTLVYSGRPLRTIKDKYQMSWDNTFDRIKERDELLKQGIVPIKRDYENIRKGKKDKYNTLIQMPNLSGQVCGAINDILPAKVIIDNIIKQAIEILNKNNNLISKL